jgi:hypothetical protein
MRIAGERKSLAAVAAEIDVPLRFVRLSRLRPWRLLGRVGPPWGAPAGGRKSKQNRRFAQASGALPILCAGLALTGNRWRSAAK